jgi:glucose-1-phosphate thymidylyltransferase
MADRVTRAIVDAASTDSGALSGRLTTTRYLMPIANLPVICHVLAELSSGGIEEARILTFNGVRAELETLLGTGEAWNLRLSYDEVEKGHGRQAVQTEIHDAVSREPVLVYPGDCLFPGKVQQMRERFGRGDVDLVLLAHAAAGASRGWVRKLMRAEEQPSRVADTAMILSPATQPALEGLPTNGNGDDGVVEALLASEHPFAICELGEHWCYSDTTEELLAGNQIMLDALPITPVRGTLGDNNEVLGRVQISSSASVSSSTVHGPAVIGDGAVVVDSFIGPYTSIGPGAIVSGAEIDNTIVMTAAEIMHPGSRIEASVIGERARITRSFDLPKGLHIRIGPGGQISLS